MCMQLSKLFLLCSTIMVGHGADIGPLLKEGRKTAPSQPNRELHVAAKALNPRLVKYLLDMGADMYETDDNDMTSMHLAMESPEVLSAFIDKGLDLEREYDERGTLLYYAVSNGFKGAAELLVNRGAKLNETMLHEMVEKENIKAIQLLFDSDLHCLIDTSAKDNNGYTPMRIAVNTNNGELVKLLADYGANVNELLEDGCSLLHDAVVKKKYLALEGLLDEGAITATSTTPDWWDESLSPIGYAVWFNDLNSTKIIYERGIPKFVEHQLLLLAVEAHSYDVINWLLKEVRVDVNKVSKYGMTALHTCARHNVVKACKQLLKNGADRSKTTTQGKAEDLAPVNSEAELYFKNTKFKK